MNRPERKRSADTALSGVMAAGSLAVLHVVGLHLDRPAVILNGFIQPALAVGDAARQEIPLPVLLARLVEQLFRLIQVARVDQVAHPDIQRIRGSGGPALLISIAAGGAITPRGAPAGALLGDGVVGLVDFLHLLLSQVGQGIVLIVVRMVLPGQLAVGFFHLVVAGVLAHSKNTIGISHLSFLQIFLFRNR